MDGSEPLIRYPLGRRGLVMSGLISGFTLATARVQGQEIRTDTNGLVAGDTQVYSDGDNLPAYFARPDGPGPFPIIVVIEEVFGVHEYIADVCRRLAKSGYLAVAPELYARIGDLSVMTDAQQIMREVISKAPDDQIFRDLDNTAIWASRNGGDLSRLGVTGFCRGGRAVWLYDAYSSALKAAVSWYGPIRGQTSPIQPWTALDAADRLHAPLLGLYGGQDPVNPVPDVQAAEAKARKAGKTIDIVIYRDAPHAFHSDYRPSYRKEYAEDGWTRMLAWFKKYGVA